MNVALSSRHSVHATRENSTGPACHAFGAPHGSESYRPTTREVTCRKCIKFLAEEAKKEADYHDRFRDALRVAYACGLRLHQPGEGRTLLSGPQPREHVRAADAGRWPLPPDEVLRYGPLLEAPGTRAADAVARRTTATTAPLLRHRGRGAVAHPQRCDVQRNASCCMGRCSVPVKMSQGCCIALSGMPY